MRVTSDKSHNLLVDGIWAFFLKASAGLTQIVIAVFLTWNLSPEDFGLFQIAQRIFIFCATIGAFGLGWISVQKIANDFALNDGDNSIGIIIRMSLNVLIVSSAIGCLYIIFFGVVNKTLFGVSFSGLEGLFFSIIVCLSLMQVVPEFLRGAHSIRKASIFSGFFSGAIFLFLISLFHVSGFELNLEHYFALYFSSLLVAVVCSGASIYLLFKQCGALKRTDFNVDLRFLKQGAPILGSSLLLFIIGQADVWFVASLSSVEDAGYYAAAAKLVWVLTVPLMVLNSVVSPITSRLLAKGERFKLERLLRATATVTLVVSVLLGFILVVFPDLILGLLFGSAYSKSSSVLQILSLGQIVAVALGPCSILLVMAGEQKQLLKTSVVSASVFVVLSMVLGPSFGAEGVAISVSAGFIISQALIAYIASVKLGVRTFFTLNLKSTDFNLAVRPI